MADDLPEQWLRGTLPDVDPLLAPVLNALMQASEDLHRHVAGLSAEKIWLRPYGLPSLGFHLRHIAGSLDRLTTYLEGGQLSAAQLEFLNEESVAGADAAQLLSGSDTAIERTSNAVRALSLDGLREARSVGRKNLPTTVIGLAVHLAEHTQRHVGQAITTAKLLRAR